MLLGFPPLFKCSHLLLTHFAWNNHVGWERNVKNLPHWELKQACRNRHGHQPGIAACTAYAAYAGNMWSLIVANKATALKCLVPNMLTDVSSVLAGPSKYLQVIHVVPGNPKRILKPFAWHCPRKFSSCLRMFEACVGVLTTLDLSCRRQALSSRFERLEQALANEATTRQEVPDGDGTQMYPVSTRCWWKKWCDDVEWRSVWVWNFWNITSRHTCCWIGCVPAHIDTYKIHQNPSEYNLQ